MTVSALFDLGLIYFPTVTMAAVPVDVVLDSDVPLPDVTTTPSARLHGISPDLEAALRVWGCELIQHAGLLLRKPQTVMASAQTLLQRFYFRVSLLAWPVEDVAPACLFLAAKVEEAPNRLRDVMTAVHHVRQHMSRAYVVNGAQVGLLDTMSGYFFEWNSRLVAAELRILQELGFCVHIRHPHKVNAQGLIEALQLFCFWL
jgi:hypothetical protein